MVAWIASEDRERWKATGRDHGPLDASVLVLNKHFAPIHVTTARRAFILLFKGFAEAIAVVDASVTSLDLGGWLELDGQGATEDDDYVRTASRKVRVPRIVRLTVFDRLPQRAVSFSRRNVLARDGYRCQYCGKSPSPRELTLDHVMPRSRGGRHWWTNVVACCRRCNDRKGHRELHETSMALLQKPAVPSMNPILHRRLRQRKYRSWRIFVKSADEPRAGAHAGQAQRGPGC